VTRNVWLAAIKSFFRFLPVICVDARHAKAALSLKVNETDANDAHGLAQIMRVGWYREVTVKGLDCQAARALLARAQIVSQITTLKNCVRGILKTFGRLLPKGLRSQFPARVRAAIDGHPVLVAIIEPTLQVLEATRAQLLVYDKAVIQRARSDDTARQLMSAPGIGTVVALAYMTGVEDPARFKRSSSVAAYFGMTPRRYQSGEVDHAGRISKCGDGMVRGLLFEAAKVLLSRSARPSALKTWGEPLANASELKRQPWRLPASLQSFCIAQILADANKRLAAQMDPGMPTPVGSFSITELGDAADKIGKDTNFRGLSAFNNVIYLTKGSGGNGVNTVFFIDTSGAADSNGNPHACPNGVGVPSPSATLPTTPIFYSSANLATKGVFPYNMCVLNGFTTTLAKKTTNSFPFGVWFANATTLYVADEGNGTNTFSGGTYTAAAGQTTAGLQKWVFDTVHGQWNLAYVLSAGLGLGVPYTVSGYPAGNNPATGLPWSPATDGLRNLMGHVNRDGTATIWAVTSTVSGNGDQGADPNKLVKITDNVAATTPPASESFTTIRTARFGEVLRGVSFTPGTGVPPHHDDDDDDHDHERH